MNASAAYEVTRVTTKAVNTGRMSDSVGIRVPNVTIVPTMAPRTAYTGSAATVGLSTSPKPSVSSRWPKIVSATPNRGGRSSIRRISATTAFGSSRCAAACRTT